MEKQVKSTFFVSHVEDVETMCTLEFALYKAKYANSTKIHEILKIFGKLYLEFVDIHLYKVNL